MENERKNQNMTVSTKNQQENINFFDFLHLIFGEKNKRKLTLDNFFFKFKISIENEKKLLSG